MTVLVLSLFPGIGLLDMAFEEEGFCVVRGPDLLWGGDIRKFVPPYGVFDGIIGGPPCQAHSQLRYIVEANGFKTAPDLIPEFVRCIDRARPRWFLMENVRKSPTPRPEQYLIETQIVKDVWVGGDTQRERKFTFGRNTILHSPHGRFQIETAALHAIDVEPAVTCDMRRRPVARGGSGKLKRRPHESGGRTSSLNRGYGAETLDRMAELQGVPDSFLEALREHGAFTAKALKTGIGNGVPLPMGRAVARAVAKAVGFKRQPECSAYRSQEFDPAKEIPC